MQTIHTSVKKILACGESMRDFLAQPYVSAGDIKGILRRHGFFLSDYEKEHSIPYMSRLILAPSEFEELVEKQRTKEDRTKVTSSEIAIVEGTDLRNILTAVQDPSELLDLDSRNIEIEHIEGPVFENDQRARYEFTLTRHEIKNNWHNQPQFQGKIEVELDKATNVVTFRRIRTSAETGAVASAFIRKQKAQFRSLGIVADKTEREVTFGSFSNEQRAQFLFSLAESLPANGLEFDSIPDIDIAPDPKQKPFPENTSVDWMRANIKSAKLAGNIHETAFVRDDTLYKYLVYSSIQVTFKFSLRGAVGSLRVRYHFPAERGTGEIASTAELEIDIESLSTENRGDTKLAEIREYYLMVLDEKKRQLFAKTVANS